LASDSYFLFFFIIVILLLIIISAASVTGLAVRMGILLLLLGFFEFISLGLHVEPVDDVRGVHGVLRVKFEHEHHLGLGEHAVVREEFGRFSLRGQGHEGFLLLLLDLSLGRLLLLLLAGLLVEGGEAIFEVIASHNALRYELSCLNIYIF